MFLSCGSSASNRRLDGRSRMRREFHVRFSEGLGVRFPGATRLTIFVKSEAAGNRVLTSLEKFLTKRLRLKVNREKSAINRPWDSVILGYSFTKQAKPRAQVSPKSIRRLKQKLKPEWKKGKGRKLEMTIVKLNRIITGWASYYRLAEKDWSFKNLDKWIRHRIRCIIWRQWKRPKTRMKKLVERGVSPHVAKSNAYSSAGPWRASCHAGMQSAFPNRALKQLGLKSLLDEYRRFAHSM